jgi:hypothetical protein
MNKKTRGEVATEVSDIAGATNRAHSPVPRALDDMDGLVRPGAREIATLSVIARSQDWQFKPLMEALQAASKISDWSRPFMVAQVIEGDRFGPRFNWRDAPYRFYKSFEDFYEQELEATWGKWEDLQRTWTEVVKGKITEAEARIALEAAIVLGRRGRPKKGEGKGADGTLKRGSNSSAYLLARLDRDGHAALAAKVRAGQLSANAAAVEAGFRKQATPLERVLKLLPKLTRSEWQQLKRDEDRRRGSGKEEPK